MQWDLLSNHYLLVAHKDGAVALWDAESLAPLHAFDRQGGGVTALAWMPWAPGNFATVNSRTGVMRVWNVSQTQPIELVRVNKTGVGCFVIVPGERQAVYAGVDGVVGVFDLDRRRTVFNSKVGHKETIFDIAYSPADPNTLATASYDSTIKVRRRGAGGKGGEEEGGGRRGERACPEKDGCCGCLMR